MLRKSPLAPLCLSMTGKGLPKRGIRGHLYYLNSPLRDYNEKGSRDQEKLFNTWVKVSNAK